LKEKRFKNNLPDYSGNNNLTITITPYANIIEWIIQEIEFFIELTTSGGIIMRFAVLGAGSAGQGIAGYLALHGHEIKLYNRTQKRISKIQQSKTLKVTGILEGNARIQNSSTCIEDIVTDCDYILLTARAFGHKTLVEESLPFISNHSKIVVFTAYWAALTLQSILSQYNRKDITIIETTLLPLACRIISPGHVHISGAKSKMRMAAYPYEHAYSTYKELHSVLPQLFLGKNVLETSLENYNPVIHVPIALFNIEKLQKNPESFLFYNQGVSPQVAKIIDALDKERIAISSRLGLDLDTAQHMLKDYYNVKGASTYQIIKNWKAVKEYVLPAPFEYVREELLYGLSPLISLCKCFSVPVPTASACIALWSAIDEVNYQKDGIKISDFGPEGMKKEDFLNLLRSSKLRED
jgi:opine dehydrogenase